jgi:hypothetical protein
MATKPKDPTTPLSSSSLSPAQREVVKRVLATATPVAVRTR